MEIQKYGKLYDNVIEEHVRKLRQPQKSIFKTMQYNTQPWNCQIETNIVNCFQIQLWK